MIKQRLYVLFFIPLIIFSSGGLNLFKHVCYSHKHSYVSLFEMPNCAEDINDCDSCCTCGSSNSHDSHNKKDKPIDDCQNFYKFILTVDQVSKSPDNSIKFNLIEKNFVKLLFKISEIIDIDTRVFHTFYNNYSLWDIGIKRDKGSSFIPILISNLKIDC